MGEEFFKERISMDVRCSVVGLGKLGASMAAAMASRGLEVVCVDVDPRAVDLVNAGRAPTQETGLDELIAANRSRLRATRDTADAVLASDVTFVIVPTPSDERGAFSLEHITRACEEIGRALGGKDGYHLVVLTSTVLPGVSRQVLLPVLERTSGRIGGEQFGVCYSPEFVALGSVVHDFLEPDMTLVGELDARSGDLLEATYTRILTRPTPCRRMSLENAELTKLALNTFVTTKIVFANMLADLCERLPGGDVDAVTEALGTDRRIGRAYLTGAMGYGGPCFPRDNAALAFLARALGTRAELAETTDATNRMATSRLTERCLALVPGDATIAVLGLAFKPASHVIEESPGLALAQALAAAGRRVVAHDPLVPAIPGQAQNSLVLTPTLSGCLEGAGAVVIATPDPAFARLTEQDLARCAPGVIVVDGWRLLAARLANHPSIRYVAVGTSDDDEGNTRRLAAVWAADRAGGPQR